MRANLLNGRLVKRTKRLWRSPVFRARMNAMKFRDLARLASTEVTYYAGRGWEVVGGSAFGEPPRDARKAGEALRQLQKMEFLALLWNALEKKLRTQVGRVYSDPVETLELEGRPHEFPLHWWEIRDGVEFVEMAVCSAHVAFSWTVSLLIRLLALLAAAIYRRHPLPPIVIVGARPLPHFSLTPRLLAQRPQVARG